MASSIPVIIPLVCITTITALLHITSTSSYPTSRVTIFILLLIGSILFHVLSLSEFEDSIFNLSCFLQIAISASIVDLLIPNISLHCLGRIATSNVLMVFTALLVKPWIFACIIWIYLQITFVHIVDYDLKNVSELIVFISIYFSCLSIDILCSCKRRQQISRIQQNHKYRLSPDERKWFDWSTSQFLSWFIIVTCYDSDKLSRTTNNHGHVDRYDEEMNTANDNDHYSLEIISKVITQHRINGKTLPHLQIQHLCHLGLPFRDAASLFSRIQELIQNNPNEKNMRHSDSFQVNNNIPWMNNNYEIDLDAWLGKQQVDQRNNNVDAHYYRGSPHNINSEQARQLAYDRFGIDMPEMRTDCLSNPPSPSKSSSSDDSHHHDEAEYCTSNQSPPFFSLPSHLDENLIQSMPPNIQEIVRRRPELWQKLAASSSGSSETNNSSCFETETQFSNDQSNIIANMPPHLREIAQRRPDILGAALSGSGSLPLPPIEEENFDYDDEEDDLENGVFSSYSRSPQSIKNEEMNSLLRKRRPFSE